MQYESSKEETRQEDATQIRDIVPPRSFEYNIQYQEKHLPHTTFYSKSKILKVIFHSYHKANKKP